MTATRTEQLELAMQDLEKFLERVRPTISESDFSLLDKLVRSHAYVSHLVETQGTTIRDLRRLFGVSSEKMRKVLDESPGDEENAEDASSEPDTQTQADDDAKNGKPKKHRGNGRNGAGAYGGAKKIAVPHTNLKKRGRCPDCGKGKLYPLPKPAVIVRIVGQAPLQATVYELDRLRCNLCGQVFTADPPEGIGSKKYDATAATMIALLRYGSGLPFKRLEGLQEGFKIPLPTSTQWDIVNETAVQLEPAYRELIRQAAQGEVVHNDDTSMTVLELTPKRRGELFAEGGAHEHSPGRTGTFTSGIVSTRDGHQTALFFTGCKHAGENIKDLLTQRAEELRPPIQMCDGLGHNLPKDLEVILANCLVHGRRNFVEVVDNFPDECRHVLETLADIYKNEAVTREERMSAEARLEYHQARSAVPMTELNQWFTEQFTERHVEPNSSLGRAISYMNNHWDALTLFLREPGAPLDNNICERALKKAILHRKNSLFYKTLKGAHVGDLFMSLIHTCRLNGVDPFDYITELQRNAQALIDDPQQCMPWNYQQASATIAPTADAAS